MWFILEMGDIVKDENMENLNAKIGPLETDENGQFRMINGNKIYQIEEKSDYEKNLNDAINRFRASGLSVKDWLNNQLR